MSREIEAYLVQIEHCVGKVREILKEEEVIEISEPSKPLDPIRIEGKIPNIQNIHRYLRAGFGEQELRRLFYEPKFSSLKNSSSRLNSLSDLVNLIVDYAERRLLIEDLLAWAYQENPNQYKNYEPFFS